MGHMKVGENFLGEIIEEAEEIKTNSKQKQTIAAETTDVR